MVGRTRKGDPLEELVDDQFQGVLPTTPSNQFNYDSTKMARAVHLVRISAELILAIQIFRLELALSSPTDSQSRFQQTRIREDIMSSTRFHRVLRRGREYGPGLSPEHALQPDHPDQAEHGIQFICLNANISRQFEFVQGAWVMNTKFDAHQWRERSALGQSPADSPAAFPVTSNFLLPQESGVARRVEGLPQFVTVRGGAYFFLPGLRALSFSARNRA